MTRFVILAAWLATAASAGCNVVPSLAPRAGHSAGADNAVQTKAGELLLGAAEALGLMDRVTAGVGTLIGAGGLPNRTAYQLMASILENSGTGTLTHQGSAFTYRSQSQGAEELTAGRGHVYLMILGQQVGSTISVTSLNLEHIGSDGQPLTFAFIGAAAQGADEAYVVDFTALGAFMDALRADGVNVGDQTLSGVLSLRWSAGQSYVAGDALSYANAVFTLNLGKVRAVGAPHSQDLQTLQLIGTIESVGSAGVIGQVAIDTTNAKRDQLPVLVKAGFKQTSPTPVVPTPTPTPTPDAAAPPGVAPADGTTVTQPQAFIL